MVGCFSFFTEWECVFLLLFLLGGTTYRGPNYLPPSSWSCQSSTHDSRCHWPTDRSSHSDPGQSWSWKHSEKCESSTVFVPSHLKCLGTLGPVIKLWKGTVRQWDDLTFPLSLTPAKSGQLGPSLPQIQCDNRLGLDSAPPWRTSGTSLQPIRFLLAVLSSGPPVFSAGPVELRCPTFYPRSQGLNHVCFCSLNKERSGFRY